MAVVEIKRRVNLDAAITPESISGTLYGGEQNAHKFVIETVKNGSVTALTGTVTAVFLRKADNVEVPLTGTIESGRAAVTLAASCYAVPGRFEVTIFVTENGAKTAVYSANGNVRNTSAGTIVDPGEVVPDITDILAAYADVVEATENANTAAEAARQAIAGLDDLTTRVARNEATAAAANNRVNWLYKLLNRQTFDILTDNVAAYEKAVPAGARACAIEAAGGKTIVLNQTVQKNQQSGTNIGLTFTNNGDGSWTLTGQPTDNNAFYNLNQSSNVHRFIKGHKYLMCKGTSAEKVGLYAPGTKGVSTGTTGYSSIEGDIVFTANTDNSTASFVRIQITNAAGEQINATITPQCFDLTLMFGAAVADTITTPEQAYALGVPRNYVEYNAGELRSANVYRVVIMDANEHEVDNMLIPYSVRGSVTGWGWSVGSVYNSIEYNAGAGEWTYIQRVASVDMGTLTWQKSNDYPGLFYAPISDAMSQTPLMCADYAYFGVTQFSGGASHGNRCLTSYSESSGVRIFDTAYASYTAQQFASAMSGKVLYYAKAAATQSPITELMPPYDLLNCYYGTPAGTTGMKIVFDQVSSELKLPVFNSESYFINLSEAIGNV